MTHTRTEGEGRGCADPTANKPKLFQGFMGQGRGRSGHLRPPRVFSSKNGGFAPTANRPPTCIKK